MQEYFFDDRTRLVNSVVDTIKTELNQALDEKQFALLAVSGGSSPEPVYQALS